LLLLFLIHILGEVLSELETNMTTPIMQLKNIKKHFGSVIALDGVSFEIKPGECHCLLGDNGAGKSTFIKIMSGVYNPTEGSILFEEKDVYFNSPNDAIKLGIATVYQDLGMIPLMSVSRNFFMGNEPVKRKFGLNFFDSQAADEITMVQMSSLGINLRGPDQPVGTLSGGERQAVAIARAVYFGAKVLILDEPTSALGVRQTSNVLATIDKVRKEGVAVVFISHNIRHALAVGDRFTVLNRGATLGTAERGCITPEDLQDMMAGGEKLAKLEESLGGAI
jgi:simple sugar transport system ATP-binding protein